MKNKNNNNKKNLLATMSPPLSLPPPPTSPPILAKSKKIVKKSAKLKRIRKNREYLLLLSHCSQKLREIILKNGNDNLIKAILEIIVNTLKGNANIGQKIRDKLKKYKRTFRRLCCPQLSLKSKRKVLVQEGGFLHVLLPTLISGVLSHIFSNINKK